MLAFREITKKYEKQIARLNPIFKVLDTDSNGFIDAEDLYKLLKVIDDRVTLDDISDVLGKFNTDFDKRINNAEFIKLVSFNSETIEKSKVIKNIFSVFDRDKDGLISRKDFEQTLSDLGEHFSSQELDDVFGIFDESDDGNIDLEEFNRIILTDEAFNSIFLFK